ncbi:MAG: peptidase T [Marinilabiliaceae bacterium]|jgi:tripeptide aminopeptidase|nr:peptidase T [Marinilabiliaceae bacterium]
MERVSERFLRYVKIDTQSDESSDTCPSTEKQFDLARLLEKELKELGLSDVILDENGYVRASLPSNTEKELPVVGFIAHMDTSPDMSGSDVKPRIVSSYDGSDIALNNSTVLSPKDFPQLLDYTGHDLITTDGTTLLGADDKAGIAEIMCALEYFINNPGIKHGTIKVGFTPDEEIGRGADRFDVKAFGADFAYTIDGGQAGELEFENFNAALATITFRGRNVHPGTAKNQMLNSMHLAVKFMDMLPADQRPEHTEGYEGFFHLVDIDGTVEETVIRYLIRDHSREEFGKKKDLVRSIAEFIDKLDSRGSVTVEIKDQYNNMREKIEPYMHIIDLAGEAIKNAGVVPVIKPIRGGTDGARLSFMGLPCPNIFTGGHNFHGKYEYISIQSMEKAVETIRNIITSIVTKY